MEEAAVFPGSVFRGAGVYRVKVWRKAKELALGDQECDLLAGWDGTFPVQCRRKPSWAVVVSLLLEAAAPFPLLVPLVCSFLGFERPAIPLTFLVPWAGVCLLVAAGVLTTWEEFHFTRDRVECKKHVLVWWRRWTEPLDTYAGLVAKRETVWPDDVAPRVLYKLVLRHLEKPCHSVMLYSSYSTGDVWGKHSAYAQMLGVSRLFESGLENRGACMDRRLISSSDELGPSGPRPPHSLQVIVMEEGLRLRTKRWSRGAFDVFVTVVLVSVFLGFFVYGLWQLHESHLTVALVAWAWDGVVGAFALVFGLDVFATREELTVTPRRAKHRKLLMGRWDLGTVEVKAENVQSVLVSLSDEDHPTVQIVTQDAVIEFGYGVRMDDQERLWVRDCIAALLLG